MERFECCLGIDEKIEMTTSAQSTGKMIGFFEEGRQTRKQGAQRSWAPHRVRRR